MTSAIFSCLVAICPFVWQMFNLIAVDEVATIPPRNSAVFASNPASWRAAQTRNVVMIICRPPPSSAGIDACSSVIRWRPKGLTMIPVRK